jgi:hypothetical protein
MAAARGGGGATDGGMALEGWIGLRDGERKREKTQYIREDIFDRSKPLRKRRSLKRRRRGLFPATPHP